MLCVMPLLKCNPTSYPQRGQPRDAAVMYNRDCLVHHNLSVKSVPSIKRLPPLFWIPVLCFSFYSLNNRNPRDRATVTPLFLRPLWFYPGGPLRRNFKTALPENVNFFFSVPEYGFPARVYI